MANNLRTEHLRLRGKGPPKTKQIEYFKHYSCVLPIFESYMGGDSLVGAYNKYAEHTKPEISLAWLQTKANEWCWSTYRKSMRKLIQQQTEVAIEEMHLEQANAVQHAREAGRREGASAGAHGIPEMMEAVDDAIEVARSKIKSAKSAKNTQMLNGALDTLNKAMLLRSKLMKASRTPEIKSDADADAALHNPNDATDEELAEIEAALQES